nr:MAG TPA: hypothetical protein [Caudoviricetes sp.]
MNHLPTRCPAYVSLCVLGFLNQCENRLVVHLSQLTNEFLFIRKPVVNGIDGFLLFKPVMSKESTFKQSRESSHRLIFNLSGNKPFLLHLRNRSTSKLKSVLLTFVSKLQLFSHDICPPFNLLLLRLFVHRNRSRRSNGDSHIHNLVYTAADREYRQLTVKLKLTVRTSRSKSTAAFRTPEPYSVFLVLTFKSFQLLIIGESIVRGKFKSVKALNTRNVSLHIVRQSSSFQHFRSTTKVGELLNVNQLLPCVSRIGLLHEENFISANSHDSLPPVNYFVFRYNRSVTSHYAINCCFFLVRYRIHQSSCKPESFHLFINERNDSFALSFFTAGLIRVNIYLI